MTNTTHYAALDAAILEAIRDGAREFIPICTAVQLHSEAIAKAENEGRQPSQRIEAWRIVDRRLQFLRKAGHTSYTRPSKKNPGGGWALKEAA